MKNEMSHKDMQVVAIAKILTPDINKSYNKEDMELFFALAYNLVDSVESEVVDHYLRVYIQNGGNI